MTSAEDKEKADKLAAAKKRFEQLKKQKGKKGAVPKKDDKPAAEVEASAAAEATEDGDGKGKSAENGSTEKGEEREDAAPESGDAPAKDGENDKPAPETPPSLTLQSKARSSSFRRASVAQTPLSPTHNNVKSPTLPPLSPDGDTVTEIYRKQAWRIEELEKENRRLEKDLGESETRWKKAEDEVEELRDAKAELLSKGPGDKSPNGEADQLRSEIASLRRQNAHLQSQSSKSSRHVTSPSQSHLTSTPDLEEALDSKSATIESMEMEISNLRAQLDRQSSTLSAHSEQVAALEEKLQKSRKAAELAQRELTDLKKNLERTSERAVKEGSQRTSAETRVLGLERELAESRKSAEDLLRKSEALEKKANTLTTLHRESDSRSQGRSRELERAEKEAASLKARLGAMDNEILGLREEKERWKKRNAEGIDDDGVDELEDEERAKLKSRIRELESEVFELKRGLWRDRRKELDDDATTSPSSRFDDVDLTGAQSPARRRSRGGSRGGVPGGGAVGLSHVISDGFSALTGRSSAPLTAKAPLLEEDDEFAFDEDAFRAAAEEEARRRVERVREIKRGLREWEGWRLDLVESRAAGGGGVGEIFEV
ncbi:MAG: hypothetical protein M1832_003913 [Thelocarpon impressellum]|nr:MAG: hypothetical protein M1832_003913 [Thelocarpon impressellum]